MERARAVLRHFLESLLDLALPRDALTKELHSLSPAELFSRAERAAQDDPGTIVLFAYRDPLVRKAVWQLKYRGDEKVASLLAACLHDFLAEELAVRLAFGNFARPIAVPIPLSKERRRERGFNQCELVLEKLAARDGGAVCTVAPDVLRRIRHTESQTSKNRRERLANLRDCFAVPAPEKIRGRNILVLDDVTTTGATFAEARRALRNAGAKKVLCVALAH